LDFTAVFFSCSVAYLLRFDTLSMPLYYFVLTAVLALFVTLSLSFANFYQAVNSTLSIRQSMSAIVGLTIAAMLTMACLFFTKTSEDYSRVWLVTSISITLLLIITARFTLSKVFNISGSKKAIMLVGSGTTALNVAEKLTNNTTDNVYLALHLDAKELNSAKQHDLLSQISRSIESYRKDENCLHGITEVWITYDVFNVISHELLLDALSDASVTLVYIPETPLLALIDSENIELTLGVPTISINISRRKKLHYLIKFIEDQVVAWSALILLSPILITVAVLIKLESRGPVFYKQVRYGLGGKDFLIWKFRTMQNTSSSKTFKQAQIDDPRVTRVGRILRRTSIDELPQLINVIAGKMSIVGPRPHPTDLNEAYRGSIKNYMYRHTFKPGITGLAQVKGFRGETTAPQAMENRIKYDLEYIQNWSVALDMKIILLTIVQLLKSDNAH
jgi:putative colanic acid biosynthesis UDP-glucose lipid carrier transferase